MKSLADEWRCDASNATWIVDRLEKLGLAERKTVPHGRRVKLVVLLEQYFDPLPKYSGFPAASYLGLLVNALGWARV
jgi:hypothetical protein